MDITNQNLSILRKLSDRRKTKNKMDIHIYNPLFVFLSNVKNDVKKYCFLAEKKIVGVDNGKNQDKKLYIMEYVPFSTNMYYSYPIKKQTLIDAFKSGDYKDLLPQKRPKTKIEFIEHIENNNLDSFYKNEYIPLKNYNLDTDEKFVINDINERLTRANDDRLIGHYRTYIVNMPKTQLVVPNEIVFYDNIDDFFKNTSTFSQENSYFLGDFGCNKYSNETVKVIHNEKIKSILSFLENWI